MNRSKVVASLVPLAGLRADLRGNRNARVKVGILAADASRFNVLTATKGPINNPTLGLVHEFGSASLNIPARSFLRMPLEIELPKKLKAIGVKVWQSIIDSKGIIYALESLGTAGMQTVEQAFRTGGFGRWQALSARTIRRKKSSAILIDSGQLRRSIFYAVVGARKP